MGRSQTRTSTLALVAAIVAAVFVVPVAHAWAETAVIPGAAGIGGGAMQALAADADRLSGRGVTVVCAAGDRDWAQKLSEAGLSGAAGEYYGFSLIRRGEMHLSPYVCEGLRLGASASGRRSHELQVAWSVNVLIHESVHLARFSTDDKVAEACARLALPSELRRLYGVRFHSAQMRRLTSAAAWFRGTMPTAYQGGTCAAPAA